MDQKTTTLVEQLFTKDTVTVLVTDSGLGGLSVAADVEARAHRAGLFRHVNVIFCNALAARNYGYNSMTTREEKIRVFSSALTGFVRWYHPDIVLIACNTLSVLYAETEFAKRSQIPVVGIVDLGIDMMAAKLNKDTAAAAIILGTPTTISANKHREGLIHGGVAERMIVPQACRNLESEIQDDPASPAVQQMIGKYLADALAAVPPSATKIVAGLCCTHYGYSRDEFRKEFQKLTRLPVEIVDPNPRMADILFPRDKPVKIKNATTDARIVSRTDVTQDEVASLGALLERVSPPVAAALRNCEVKQDLFEFVPSKR